MKRAAAIALSLMFLWLQAMASAPTSAFLAKTGCACGDCTQMDCCVTPATPDTQKLPATVASPASHNDLSVFATTLVAWTLPATAPAQFPAFPSAPLPAPDVPLFTWHCARLI